MAGDYSFGRGNEFIVSYLIENQLSVLALLISKAGVGHGKEGNVGVALIVDFVEGHPVFDLIFIAFKAGGGKFYKEVHDLAVAEAAVFRHEMIRQLEVAQCYHRFDAQTAHFSKEVIVEFETFLVWFRLIPLGEDTRPGNTGAEGFEAHFRHECQVFLIMMVEVNGIVVGIDFAFQYTIGDFTGLAVTADGHDVSYTHAFAAFLPGAL